MTDPTGERDVLGGFTTGSPHEGLRARTLAEARQAAAARRRTPPWRVLAGLFAAQPRWSWALAVLLAAHVALGFLPKARPGVRAVSPRDREVAAQPDILRLPLIGKPARDPAGEGDQS